MLDKLIDGWKKANKKPEENPKDDQGDTSGVSPELLKQYQERLVGVLYDDELVNEFAPLFAKMHQHDTEQKMLQLLETKEKQIQAVADGSAYKQASPEKDEEVDTGKSKDSSNDDYSVENLIQSRGK